MPESAGASGPVGQSTDYRNNNKIRELVVAIFGLEPRPKQLEALVCVIAERKDLILIAKTSFVLDRVFQRLIRLDCLEEPSTVHVLEILHRQAPVHLPR
jgi:hypothetical protein